MMLNSRQRTFKPLPTINDKTHEYIDVVIENGLLNIDRDGKTTTSDDVTMASSFFCN